MGRGAVVRWMLVAVAAGVGAVACRQLVGIGDTPPGAPAAADAGEAGEAGGVCGLPYDGTCGACVQSSCCPEAQACAGSPSCAPFADCVAACGGDPACRAQCTPSAPRDSAEIGPLSSCLVTSCASQCGLTCGGLDEFTTPDAAAACQGCIANDGNLCALVTQVASLDDGYGTGMCLLACQGRLDCRQACADGHDAGAGPFASMVGALRATCEGACNLGGDWQCLGHVAQPIVVSEGTSTMTVQVADGDSQLLPGVAVSVCSTGTCSPGVTTDAQGIARVTVPLHAGTAGPRGYLQYAPAPDGGADITPTLYYWGFPLSEPQVTFAFPPVDAGPTLAYTTSPVLTPAQTTELASEVDATLDPSRGNLGITITDCLGVSAPGVQITYAPLDPQTHTFYGRGAGTSFLLSKDATDTDESGIVVITNALPGSMDLVAQLADGGPVVSTASVLVVAGTTTGVYMLPTQ